MALTRKLIAGPVTAPIPSGAVAPVAGTAFDYRGGRPVGALDHNFCLSDAPAPLRPVTWLCAGGLTMQAG